MAHASVFRGRAAASSEPVEALDCCWHALDADEALAALEASPGGLDSDQARARLALHGPNALPAAPTRHPVMRFLAQFKSTLIYFLLAAALAAAVLGHGLDAGVILGVVLVNATVGFLQEGKAQEALAAIRDLVAPRAQVLRDGCRSSVDVAQLVPGDIVLLEAGDRVPADLVLLHARGLLVDESLLTGESVAAQKREGAVARDAALGDRAGMAYSGTFVLTGQARGVVVATGTRTELGRIGMLVSHVTAVSTPLLRQIDRFGRRFALLVACAGAALFAYAVQVESWPWVTALMAIVAMAVGVIPEGLPAVITITLAIGVQRMAARNAVIRRMPAVETLGATSVICTDKTGTLTRNEMTARRVVVDGHTLLAGGEGYRPHGELRSAGDIDDAQALAEALPLLRCAMLCNDARLGEHEGRWQVVGDPMEGALLALAGKAGLDPAHEQAEWPRLDEIPFDAAYRFMATLHATTDGRAQVFVKGAPEAVLAMDPLLSDEQVGQWLATMSICAAEGERLLGFGAIALPAGERRLQLSDLARGVQWLGLVGFIDPPRAQARQAIAECQAAGIDVKMITGDHAATASAIARQIQLAEMPRTLTGAELDALDDSAFAQAVELTDVFARTTPQHKLRIVQALQSRGKVVAMTGDGVNDSPALKQADVGVAMGVKGTEAAREAAEMVLLDDNFASIVNAVHEGRTVYDNIRKVIAWTLPTNGGEVLGVLVAILAGLTLPMTAAQILWINLVTSATLGLALAFERAEPGLMRRAPRRPTAPLLSPFMMWRTLLVSVLFAAISFLLLFHVLGRGGSLELARTVVVNALAAMEAAYVFSVRRLHTPGLVSRGAPITSALLWALLALAAIQALFTWAGPMNKLFGTMPLGAAEVMLVAMAALVFLVLLEIEKIIMRRTGLFEETKSDARRPGATGEIRP